MKDCSICICTYKRPDLLLNCLKNILQQKSTRILELIIVDNDKYASAKNIIQLILNQNINNSINIKYFIEPNQNISLARNKAIHMSEGKYIILIDDDEYPLDTDWVDRLLNVIENYNADGVFGPIVNIYPEGTPEYRKINIYPFPGQWKTGKIINKPRGVGNVIFRKEILMRKKGPFNINYGNTGGEDAELTNWLLKKGVKFIWCDEAVVCQIIEKRKLEWNYHLKRNFQFGSNCSRIFVEKNGYLRGIFELPIRIFLGIIKIILITLFKINSPKVAFLYFITEITVQFGKICYFLGAKSLKIYDER